MRRFEFSEGASNKFWEIVQNDADLEIRWGRIGTQGQSQTKNFADAAKARAALDKRVAEKTGKGYSEVGAGDAAVPAAKVVKDKKEEKAKPAAAAPVERRVRWWRSVARHDVLATRNKAPPCCSYRL